MIAAGHGETPSGSERQAHDQRAEFPEARPSDAWLARRSSRGRTSRRARAVASAGASRADRAALPASLLPG